MEILIKIPISLVAVLHTWFLYPNLSMEVQN